MITRTIGGVLYNLAYDAENRLVSVTWPGNSAAYTYDADGKRVKSTMNGTTTHYPFAHYEVTGTTVTKYYFAGAQAVALNQGGALSYLFADHLGSTAVTASPAGTLTGELRYKAWGETRYTYGTTPTAKHYTGQYEEAGIGLYYYNARYYDPALGRFAQADTVTPVDSQGVQAWDRYAYVNNSPSNFNDPTGNTCEDSYDPGCVEWNQNNPYDPTEIYQDERENNYDDKVKIIKKYASHLPLDGDSLVNFTLLIRKAAGLFYDYDSDSFMSALTCVINAYCGPKNGVYKIGLPNKYPDTSSQEYRAYFEGKGSWASEFYDFTDNQMYHFWFYVDLAYSHGMSIANLGNELHDPPSSSWVTSTSDTVQKNGQSQQDYLLGKAGINLGMRIMVNSVNIAQVESSVWHTLSKTR